MPPLTEAALDRTCPHGPHSLRSHSTCHDGVWFVRPCDGWLRAASDEIAAAWDLMALPDGSCRWCPKTMRRHFDVGFGDIAIELGDGQVELVPAAYRRGGVYMIPIQRFNDCRDDEQREWRPAVATCHSNGDPFGLRNPFSVPPVGS